MRVAKSRCSRAALDEQPAVPLTGRRGDLVSAPDEVFVLRLTADRAGALSFAVTLDRPDVHGGDRIDELILSGRCSAAQSLYRQMRSAGCAPRGASQSFGTACPAP